MIVNPNYFYFKKAVSPKTCSKILKACRKKIIKEGSLINENKRAEKDNRIYIRPEEDNRARNCMIAWLNETWIYNILNPFIHEANKKGLGIFNLIGMNLYNSPFIQKADIIIGTPIRQIIL